MAAEDAFGILLLVFTFIDGTAAQNDVHYLVISSTVAVLLFFLVFVMGCVFYNCSAIYRSFGYVRKPKEEIERSKIKRTSSHHTSQQHLAAPTILSVEKDNVSFVQRWQDSTLEERDAVMQLGPEEPEKEYRIETTLVDNEPLDLGPFSTSMANGTVPEGLYATVDKAGIKRDSSLVSKNGSVMMRDSTELL